MLSRSSSTAGDRLRRAKSTSSQHTTSSGHQRSSTSIDPFVTRQHAETAAVEAYNRARQSEESAPPAYRPVPPKVQRRRSQTAGKTEGSHFEDARFGRRKPTPSKGDSRTTQAVRNKQPAVSEAAADYIGEEKVVTRKRSMIPPSVATRHPQPEYLSMPPMSHCIRKTRSVYVDSSPTPRRASALQDHSSTLQLSSTPVREHNDGYGGNLATLSNFGEPQNDIISSFAAQRPRVRETQTDGEMLAAARDKCLQDFQQKKLRERKSMFLAPFQRRRVTNVQKTGDSSHDAGSPPFNHAENVTFAPLPSPPEPVLASQIPITVVEKKSRNFSDTLKGRIKNAFRKASRVPTSIPAQHVEAKHFHYSASEDAYHSLSEKQPDPFSNFTAGAHPAAFGIEPKHANSRESVEQSSEAKSRVTSWANSTVAGTCASRADIDHMPHVTEHGQLKRSGSHSTLRKASSFFGRPVMNKLRKPSKGQLSSSEESHGLYSALQDRIQPPRRTPEPSHSAIEEKATYSRPPSATSTLPSQQRADATLGSMNKRYGAMTVRSVTPDPSAYKLGICSPVAEVRSPDITNELAHSSHQAEPAGITPLIVSQRRPSSKALPPSQEQLARRMEKSRNRWQSPLEELSPIASQSTRATVFDDNPYELRSLSQTHQQPPATSDLPHHTKVGHHERVNRAKMLSPSVYSRATDGASPRPVTPMEPRGTVVTITGREIRSYSISPPKMQDLEPPKPSQTSGQWRKWLSDEMGSFKAGLDMLTLTQALPVSEPPAVASSATPVVKSRDTTGTNSISKLSSALQPPDPRPSSAATNARPRFISQRPSFMNDRYPMVDGSRNSSAQSIASRGDSRMGDRTVSGSEQSSQGATTRSSAEGQAQKNLLNRQHVIIGRQSIAQLETAARNKSPLGSRNTTIEPTMSGALPDEQQVPPAPSRKVTLTAERKARVSARHKSNFELRANYNNSSNGRPTPIEIRRKPMNETTTDGIININNNYSNHTRENKNMLEDTTILDISAGPYAPSYSLPGPTNTNATISSRANKENTPPLASSDPAGLPALSSSEWLSASSTHKVRRLCQSVQPVVQPTAVHPALRTRDARAVSRYSPVRLQASPAGGAGREIKCGGGGGGVEGSPGQRLAGEWLERRSREGTPAFL
ncbi:hypothetical protein LTR08_006867 [Meristemomyces frigidus]|nr:hypothetical protein LTR08_006867 [Meristemomyces frigidus]